MIRRRVALGLLLVAVAVHLGLTVPARRGRDAARQAFAGAREERERLRTQIARQERRTSRSQPLAPEDDAAAARALRLSLVAATDGLPVAAVQVAAAPQRRGAVAARGRLVAEGTQADLLRAAGRLAEPASGAVLERVQLVASRGGALRLELEALRLRAPAIAAAGPQREAPAHGTAGFRGQAGS